MLAVLTVNSNLDNITLDANLTIREALAVVNSGTTAGVIPGLARALTVGELAQVNTATALGSNDRVQFSFPDPTILLDPVGASALPIAKPVTILGPGFATLAIDAQTNFPVFTIAAGSGTVTIKGLSLQNGNNVGSGGAIASANLGTLSIAESRITGSVSTLGNGGAIATSGNLVLNNVTVGGPLVADKNTALGSGGGIYAGGMVTLKNSTVSGNTAGFGDGGGIYAVGFVSIDKSTVADNAALVRGGGVFGAAIVIQNSTISGNTVTTGNGGGVFTNSTIVVQNSTITQNKTTAGAFGGGISGDNVTVQNSTVAINQAVAGTRGGISASSRLVLHNSIVAGNTGGVTPDLNQPAFSDVLSSLVGETGTIANAGQFTVSGIAQNGAGNFIGNAVLLMPITPAQALGAASVRWAVMAGRRKQLTSRAALSSTRETMHWRSAPPKATSAACHLPASLLSGPPLATASTWALSKCKPQLRQTSRRRLPHLRLGFP